MSYTDYLRQAAIYSNKELTSPLLEQLNLYPQSKDVMDRCLDQVDMAWKRDYSVGAKGKLGERLIFSFLIMSLQLPG